MLTFLRQQTAKKYRSVAAPMSNRVARRIVYSLMFLSVCYLTFAGLVPFLSKTLLFDMPAQSATFDCDDSALLMYDRLSDLGIEAVPIVGDLEATGEEYQDISHVWLMAEIGGLKVAFDWGTPRLDRQHYEGYTITYDQLREFVEQDRI